MKLSVPLAATLSLTSRSLFWATTYACPAPLRLVKPIAHGPAKKSFFLPVSGVRAPRWRLRNLPSLASVWRLAVTPPRTFTKAWVLTLKRIGPAGDAAMFGRNA